MKQFFRRRATLWMLIGFCLLLGLFLGLRTGLFFTGKNIVNILEANSFKLLLAIGMTFIIASGGIDLSVGSVLSLSAIFTAITLKQGVPVWVGISVGLLSGVLMGLINGCLIHFTGINAFIITLGTSFLYRGLALIVTRGTPVSKMPAVFRTFGCGDILHIESGVYMALAAVEALTAEGRNDVLVYGVDFTADAREALKAGTMTGTMSYSSVKYTEAALKLAIAIAQGKEYAEPIYLPLTLVTVDNVAELDNWA